MTTREILAALEAPGWQEFGRSVLGRPLLARVFSGAARVPPVLFFAAIHGDEPLGAVCLLRLAAELDVRPPARTTWIAPVVSPDGLCAQRKHNAHGVDLNRNFPSSTWSAAHQPGYEPGAAPASEPETAALMALIERAGARRLVALHSPFRTVNYDGPARALAERMAATNGYGTTADIGYPTPGSFGSLYGGDRQLEVITLEIPPMSDEQAWQENRDALHEALAAT